LLCGAKDEIIELAPPGRAATVAAMRVGMPPALVGCVRIVLRAADDLRNRRIAQELGITPEKAARWRCRFSDGASGFFRDLTQNRLRRRHLSGYRGTDFEHRRLSKTQRQTGSRFSASAAICITHQRS
jgi:hypothetical protein